MKENGSQADSTVPFHSVVLQLLLASMQVTLKLGRKWAVPEASVILNRALTESEAIGLKTLTLAERAVFSASGHLAFTVCDAQSQFSAMPLLKLSPSGRLSPWM